VAVRYDWEPTAVGMGSVRLWVSDAVVAEADGVPTAPMGYSMVQEGLTKRGRTSVAVDDVGWER
jgi:hypothetical protein